MTQPFVSVLVPVRNEERHIERCLRSLAAQDYPRDRFEVLVIDGRSDDATRELVSHFAAESTLDLRLLDNPRRKTAAGLNRGLDEARGDVIVRVDGHATVAGDYLSRGVFALFDTGADCVGGVIEAVGDTWTGRAIAIAMSSRFGVGGVAFRVGGEGPVETVAFGAYRRDVFDRIGRFTEDIDKGEDDEFNYRLCDAGGSIVLVPALHARYTVRGTLPELARQYFGYGRAKPAVLARHPSQARARQFVPAAFVAALGSAAALALGGRPGPLKLLLATYSAAAGAASLVTARRHGVQNAPVLPAVFACLHVSNGLGFFAGLADLAGRGIGGLAGSRADRDSEAVR
ncbi:MAG: glycosyltransferase family 2 protein [Dehalococcoidia bacterium]|nr:MAG: glycosyltransferase family 2 protein [Dehalococcoidia bacterium]